MHARRLDVVVARISRLVLLAVVSTAGLSAVASVAGAATFTVNTTADLALPEATSTVCPATCSLREAVQAADNADGAETIELPAGTYKLTISSKGADDPSTGDLDIISDPNPNDLTITGAGASSTTIDATGIDRAFSVDAGSTLSLSGITITDGNPSYQSTTGTSLFGGDIYTAGTLSVADSMLTNSTSAQGGAIYDSGGQLTLDADTLANAESGYGGGVYLDGGSLTDTNSTFDGLASFNAGGAVFATGTYTATFTGTSFSNDDSAKGGAIAAEGLAALSLAGAVFNDNAGSNGGGGVYYNSPGGSLTVSDSRFSGDSAGSGAGIDAVSGDLTLTQSSFAGEAAASDGGALDLGTTGAVAVANTTLSANRAGDGGGLYVNAGSPTLANDTIAGNQSAPGEGGGVYDPQLANGIENTIVAENVGGDCNESAGSADAGNNLDSDASCFGGVGQPSSDQVGVDPLLGPLRDNGGPTPTQDLRSGSPAIGNGDESTCAAQPVNGVDQRGIARPQGSSCDIGAVEAATADVAISQTAPATATVGTPITYALTVSNNGPGPAGGVTLTDTLPSGTTYYFASSSEGSCSGTTVLTCSLSSIADGARATVTISVVANNAGSITNTATVSASQADPTLSNNTSAAGTVVNAPATSVSQTVIVHTAPVVLTGFASGVSATAAKLSAIVNPAGEPATFSFQIGTSRRYGATVRGATVTGTSPHGVLATVKGLKPGRTYHFRIEATNGAGTSTGQDVTFKTPKAKARAKPKRRK